MVHTIIQTTWQTHCEPLSHIRELVFIREQQVPVADEWDDKDETAVHFLVNDHENNAIGCARLLVEENVLHIGRVAILSEYREQGIGRKLMQFVLAWCAQHQPQFKIYLHAQVSRIAFYEHLDFTTHGDVFMDAGIPHVEMWYKTNRVKAQGVTHE